MSWVAVAIAGAATVYGAVDANQKKQKNKGYITDSFQTAQQRLALKQRAGRDDAASALAERGLTGGGDVTASPIAAAMTSGTMQAQGGTPHTLGAQITSDNAAQMGLETQDLEQQKTKAEHDNYDQYRGAVINSAVQGISTGMNVSSAIGQMRAPSGGSAPIASAMAPQVGIDNPGNWFGGVHGLDPLNAPGSSWRAPSETSHGVALNGAGMGNADFHV